MQLFKKMGLCPKVSTSEVKGVPLKIITTKWVDTDKGQGSYRSRLVGREIKKDKRQDLFSPTPPLEALKFLIAQCAKGGVKAEKDWGDRCQPGVFLRQVQAPLIYPDTPGRLGARG